MIVTRDGYALAVNDEYVIAVFEEDTEYVEKLITCTYKGSKVRDNKPILDTLPPSCSGMTIPETEVVYSFEAIGDQNQEFELLERTVKDSVVKYLSAVEVVIKQKLR